MLLILNLITNYLLFLFCNEVLNFIDMTISFSVNFDYVLEYVFLDSIIQHLFYQFQQRGTDDLFRGIEKRTLSILQLNYSV